MPTFRRADAVLDFEVDGASGPAVAHLHGLTSSRERERALGLGLTDAVDGGRVLRYDARGHGRSTGPDTSAAYTWPWLADDLTALLDHVFPGEQVHGVGPSMGAGTLLHAAVWEPSRFRGLTLALPPTAWETRVPQRAAYDDAARLVEREGVAKFVELGRVTPRPPAVDPDLPETWPTVPEWLLPTVFRGAARTDLPAPEVVASLEVPAWVLAWSGDPAHPLSTARRLHELLPQSRLVVADHPHDVRTWPAQVAAQVSATAQPPAT